MEYYKQIIRVSKKLAREYSDFWDNIKHNDAFIYYKNAIEIYQGILNKKNHDLYLHINSKLFTGKCQYIDQNKRDSFANKKVDLDDLCKLSVVTIMLLDYIMFNSPRIPFDLEVYRYENRDTGSEIFNIKKGQYYRALSYVSTTLNPWLWNTAESYSGIQNNQTSKAIRMKIIIPKEAVGFYIVNAFVPTYNMSNEIIFGYPEFEILLLRGSIFKVVSREDYEEAMYLVLRLDYQMLEDSDYVSMNNYDVKPRIFQELTDQEKLFYKEFKHINTNTNTNKENILLDIRNNMLSLVDNVKIDYINNDITIKKFNKMLIKNNIKTKNKQTVYINGKQDTNLIQLIGNNIKVGKVIHLSYPIFINTKSVDDLIISESDIFICTNEYIINDNYPYLVVIKHIGNVTYVPMKCKKGIACNITKLVITKVDKIKLHNNAYYFLLESKLESKLESN